MNFWSLILNPLDPDLELLDTDLGLLDPDFESSGSGLVPSRS
jgi:hypothetical protein